MKWMPLYDKIIVELNNVQEQKSETGIVIIQDMSSNKYTIMEGTVIAVGEGRLLVDGNVKKPIVSVGDKIKFSKLQGETFVDNGKEYTIISESNILAFKKGE